MQKQWNLGFFFPSDNVQLKSNFFIKYWEFYSKEGSQKLKGKGDLETQKGKPNNLLQAISISVTGILKNAYLL